MPSLPTFADRIWFAYQCLPRDEKGKLPSWRSLEETYKLPNATFHCINGGRTDLRISTIEKIAAALRTSDNWLRHGGDNGPFPSGPVLPRPGVVWTRHGDLPGWAEAVAVARAENPQRVPGAAYFAGADLVVFRPIDVATVELVVFASGFAFHTATPTERRRYEEMDIELAEARSESKRAGRPAVKRRAAK